MAMTAILALELNPLSSMIAVFAFTGISASFAAEIQSSHVARKIEKKIINYNNLLNNN
jgi:hypothetical protein